MNASQFIGGDTNDFLGILINPMILLHCLGSKKKKKSTNPNFQIISQFVDIYTYKYIIYTNTDIFIWWDDNSYIAVAQSK